jgi:sporulation protein YlmC with PRC-barrel domain
MSDYDRYGGSYGYTRDRDYSGRNRDRSRDYDRSDNSIFGFGGSNDERRPGRGRSSRDRWGGSGWDDLRERSGRDRWEGSDREHGRERERGYGPDDYREGLPRDETSHLIASNKVEGTAVYGRNGERLGTIYNFMVDKVSGRVEYAVMAYGGFMGMGARYYPLPWRMLSYDTREGGYHVNMSDRDLEDAPSFDRSSEPRFDRDYGSWVYQFYGLGY